MSNHITYTNHHPISLPIRFLILVILVLLPYDFAFHISFNSLIQVVYQWLQNQQPWTPLIFLIINIIVVIFLLPGLIITLGAGFLFGFTKGFLLVWLGTNLGAIAAFSIARHSLSKRINQYLMTHPKLRALNEEFIGQGSRFILLTRLVPFFPFKLSNYFFGLANFSLRDFFIGTALGIIPITAINVYLGSLALQFEDLILTGRTDSLSEYWWLYFIGLVLTLLCLIYIRQHARKALLRYKTNYHSSSQ